MKKNKAFVYFFICSIIHNGISIITTPIFTRIMTPEHYGRYNVFISWFTIINVIVSLSLSQGIYHQGLVKYESESKKYSFSIQLLTTLLVILWFIVYLFFRNTINNQLGFSTFHLVCLFIMIWTNAIFLLWSNEQRLLGIYKYLLVVTISLNIIKSTISVIAVLISDDKVLARIASATFVELVFCLIIFLCYLIKNYKCFDINVWKYVIAMAIPLLPHYLSQIVLSNSDRIMIGKMMNDSYAGIYSLAYSLSLVMLIINNSIVQTINPWFYRSIKEKKLTDISKVTYFFMIVIALANIVLMLFAPEIVRLFAPVEYYEAIWVIPPISMSVYLMFMYDLFAKFSFYYEKTVLIMMASLIGAVLNVILNYIFIPIMGYYAAGYTTLFCYFVYVLCHFVIMNTLCKIKLNGDKPYSLKVLVSITAIFMISGAIILVSYYYVLLRILLIFTIVLLAILLRKKLLDSFKSIMDIISL